MKSWIAAALMLGCMDAEAAVKAPNDARAVVVYLRTGGAWLPGAVISMAQANASSLFLKEGIRLDWRDGKPPKDASKRPGGHDTVAISFRLSTPADDETAAMMSALAFAYPYGKGPLPVTVFGDRVARYLTPFHGEEAGKVLGHILAHEIGHVLEGIARHSETGVMKARWNWRDLIEIRGAGLEFEPVDRDLLRQRFVPAHSVELPGPPSL